MKFAFSAVSETELIKFETPTKDANDEVWNWYIEDMVDDVLTSLEKELDISARACFF